MNPATPTANPQVAYTAQPGDEYSFYQYRVDSPADGVWQVQLQADEVVTYGLGASIVSPVSLVAKGPAAQASIARAEQSVLLCAIK